MVKGFGKRKESVGQKLFKKARSSVQFRRWWKWSTVHSRTHFSKILENYLFLLFFRKNLVFIFMLILVRPANRDQSLDLIKLQIFDLTVVFLRSISESKNIKYAKSFQLSLYWVKNSKKKSSKKSAWCASFKKFLISSSERFRYLSLILTFVRPANKDPSLDLI